MSKDYKLDQIFYRIINGYFYITVNGQSYKVKYANNHLKYMAENLYISIMEDSRFDTEYLKQAQLDKILQANEVWTKEQEEQLDKIKKQLDKLKMRLCEYYKDLSVRDEAKKEIEELKSYEEELKNNKHSLDYLTLEYYASSIKNKYLTSQLITDLNDNPVFPDKYEDVDEKILTSFVIEINKNIITGDQIRQIALGPLWQRYSGMTDIFGPCINLNDDQINLLSLSMMFKNVRQHPECPDDEIIEDQDALEGWFMIQKDKAEKTKKKNAALSKVRGKVKNHDFVYVMTRDMKEAESIESLNDLRGKSLVNAVRSSVTEVGETKKWKDIPFIDRELKSEAYRNQKKGIPGQ